MQESIVSPLFLIFDHGQRNEFKLERGGIYCSRIIGFMLIASAAILIGFIILVWSADLFVDGAASIAENMGMPPDEFLTEMACHVLNIEATGLCGHLCMENHLQQNVP